MSFNNNMPISIFIEEIEKNETPKVDDLILDEFSVLHNISHRYSPQTLSLHAYTKTFQKDDPEFNVHIINYQERFTVKDLLIICDYYGLNIKNKKYIKDVIIEILVSFELDPINADLVSKRQTAWFFMNELKNDKFMKNYVTHVKFQIKLIGVSCPIIPMR